MRRWTREAIWSAVSHKRKRKMTMVQTRSSGVWSQALCSESREQFWPLGEYCAILTTSDDAVGTPRCCFDALMIDNSRSGPVNHGGVSQSTQVDDLDMLLLRCFLSATTVWGFCVLLHVEINAASSRTLLLMQAVLIALPVFVLNLAEGLLFCLLVRHTNWSGFVLPCEAPNPASSMSPPLNRVVWSKVCGGRD